MKKQLCLCLVLILLLPFSVCADNGYRVILPEGYTEGDPLPVYNAIERGPDRESFVGHVDYTLFDQSGVVSVENGDPSSPAEIVTFEDESILDICPEAIRYEEKDGTYMFILGEDPDHPTGPFPMDSFAVSIGRLAAEAISRSEHGSMQVITGDGKSIELSPPLVTLDTEVLHGITLSEAKARGETVMAGLELTDYECVTALDMTAGRIHSLGEWRKLLYSDAFNHPDREPDFSSATESDEGFYLVYRKRLHGAEVRHPDGESFCVKAFVNAEGVPLFLLDEAYRIGDVLSDSTRLLTAAETAACFEKGNAKREKDGFSGPRILSMELCYVPGRADNKKDGMVIHPAWYIRYSYTNGAPSEGWAWLSAEDGRLLMDCYD